MPPRWLLLCGSNRMRTIDMPTLSHHYPASPAGDRARQHFYAVFLAQAQRRPQALAIIDGKRHITYAQFLSDIDMVSRRLHSLALPKSARVAVSVSDYYLHWLALFGLWRIGRISLTLYDLGQPELFSLSGATVLLTERADFCSDIAQVVRIDPDWLDDAAELPALPADTAVPDTHPVRIILSSGTTGTSKKILLTEQVVAARVSNTSSEYCLESSHRFMSRVGADTVGGFVFTIAVWGVGGTVVFYNHSLAFDQNLAESKANLLFMSPTQLSHTVDALPITFRPDPTIRVLIGGGILPRPVARKAMQRLTQHITLLYGSTEAGTVALTSDPLGYDTPGVCGCVVPAVELQIIGADGLPAAVGSPGELRMRGPAVVKSYLDDPASSDQTFHDGWFHPGDIGTLSDSGLLTIVGRTGEVMNLGGVKIAPTQIEQALFACPGVKDLAAFALENKDGLARLWIAVVMSAGYVQETMIALFRTHFPRYASPNIIYVEAIPRNGMGKVLRNPLREMVIKHGAAPVVASNSPDAADQTMSSERALEKTSTHKATVQIDGKEYALESLPPSAIADIASLQFVDAELQRLKALDAALRTARRVYATALGDALAGDGVS